jgi:hypothetical protein
MRNVFSIKIIIIISVFLFGLTIFKLLQNETIFKNTLGRIAITYSNTENDKDKKSTNNIIKTDKSFTSFDEANFIHWDVKFYKYMAENSYGKDNSWPGAGTYAFSPLFPFLWKLSHLSSKYIGILNYLLFAFSILILSNLFLLPLDFGKVDRLCLFTLALTLPSVFSFYIPYCESTFLFTMSIALWGLFKNKFWLFFVGLIAFALSRPIFIVALAFICTDIYFLILHRNYKLFLRELSIKILPIFIGMFLTFFIQYLSSGSFFKMFQVHSKFWGHNFQLPTTITDWSTESYGMNIFAICCVVIPSAFFLYTYFQENLKPTQMPPISLFSKENRREYLFSLSIVYFIGNFLFVIVSQGGNLNGIHRYILVSPFFYIFFFILIKKLKTIEMKYILVVLIPAVVICFLLLIHGPYQHNITFLDMGYFLSVFTLIYFILFNRMKTTAKIVWLLLLIPGNTVWLCYLFNHFLNNSFIIA